MDVAIRAPSRAHCDATKYSLRCPVTAGQPSPWNQRSRASEAVLRDRETSRRPCDFLQVANTSVWPRFPTAASCSSGRTRAAGSISSGAQSSHRELARCALTQGGTLFREFAQCVAIALRGSSGDRQSGLDDRIVRRQQDSVAGFRSQHRISHLQVEAFSHVPWQLGSHRSASLPELQRSDHGSNVARMCSRARSYCRLSCLWKWPP